MGEVQNKKVWSNKEFVHLHVHSSIGSIGDSTIRIPSLVKKARHMGFSAIALTDHGSVSGIHSFISACTATKDKDGNPMPDSPIKPILGTEIYFARELNGNKDTQPDGQRGNKHLILLAKDWDGYKNLCTLSHISWVEGFYFEPRIDFDTLSKHSKGLVVSSACLSGLINSNLRYGRYEEAKKIASIFKDILREDFFLEIMYHGIAEEYKIISLIIKLGAELEIPIIATNDCLTEETFVSTDDGSKRIKNIKVGDCVWTHEGRLKKVLHINKRHINEELMIITPGLGTRKIECTKNHPLLILSGIKKGISKGKSGFYEKKAEWIKSSEIKEDDLLCIPRHKIDFCKSESFKKIINSYDFVKEKECSRVVNGLVKSFRLDKKAGVPENLRLEEDFYKVLGLFLAEGCIDKTIINFCFHRREKNLVKIVNDFFKKYNFHPTITHEENFSKVRVNSFVFSAIFESFVGRGAEKKFIKDINTYTEDEIKSVLKYYFYGDGCFRKKTFILGTTSEKLIFQASQVLNHFGILSMPNIRTGEKIRKNHKGAKGKWNDLYVLALSGENLSRFIEEFDFKNYKNYRPKTNRAKYFSDENYFYVRIKSISKETRDCDVHNIQVEDDETYLANGYIVHNCHYLEKPDAPIQNLYVCSGHNTTIENPNRMKHPYPELYLKSAQEMAEIFGDYPQFLTNTLSIAERIDNKEIEKNLFGVNRFPTFPITKGFKDQYEYLCSLAWKGLKDLGWHNKPDHVEALKKELNDVKLALESADKDFSSNFLIVRDCNQFAKEAKIQRGFGRGSGFASVLLRCLGIFSGPSPIEYGLLWERFLGFDDQFYMTDADLGFEDAEKNSQLSVAQGLIDDDEDEETLPEDEDSAFD